MNVVQDHTNIREAWALPKNASKDDINTSLSGNSDGGFDIPETMGSDSDSIDGEEVEAEVLQGILIHEDTAGVANALRTLASRQVRTYQGEYQRHSSKHTP